MNRNNSYRYLYILLLFLLTASGCSFAPKEEVLPQAPVIPTGTIEEYQKAEVIRGDLTDSVTIDCTYKAFHSESLKFNLGDVLIHHIYVEEGDTVKVGEVLADLVMSDVNRQLQDRSDQIELLKLKRTHQRELKQLSVSSRKKLSTLPGYNSQIKTKFNNEITGYDNTIKDLNDELYIEEQRLEKLYEEIKDNQIIAGMDGIVAFIASYHMGDVSNKDTQFISIYDPDTMCFVTDGSNSELFTPGLKLQIQVNQEAYNGVVIEPEELKNPEPLQEESNAVFIKVDNSENRLHNEDRGEITIIKKELRNVLYLPASAVHDDNGRSIVYVEDEGGFKSIKEIETGLTADKKIEIKSGLNEGDSVILN